MSFSVFIFISAMLRLGVGGVAGSFSFSSLSFSLFSFSLFVSGDQKCLGTLVDCRTNLHKVKA